MDGLNQMIFGLTHAIREMTSEIRNKNQQELILMKISELKGDVAAIKTQLTKVFVEQQTRYDTIAAKYAELQTQLEDAELDEQTASNVADIKTLLQQFDDTIPETQPA